jgi:hypothetical protein
MSRVSTRSKRIRVSSEGEEPIKKLRLSTAEFKKPLMKDDDFLRLKQVGFSVVVYFDNGKKNYAYQYDLDDEKTKYDGNLLLNEPINVTFKYIQTKISQMTKRELIIDNINIETNKVFEDTPKKTVYGVCQGDVAASYTSSQYRKSANDTYILLIDHKYNKYVGYIVAKRISTNNGISYYIDIICTEPGIGYGNSLLNWFMGFFGRETTNVNDPAYGVTSLSLSALSSVLTYYTRFGYMHVNNCGENEDPEIVLERQQIPILNKKPNRTSVEFINFLFLLTRKGYNVTQDPICSFISSDNITDKNINDETDVTSYVRFKSISSYDKYDNYMKDLKKRMKGKDKEEATRLYNDITVLEKAYNSSNKEYEKNKTLENKKKYFDATYNFAKYLYAYVGSCDNNGYSMKKCIPNPNFAFESCW